MISAQFLLDTNVLSEPLKPEPNPNVLSRIVDNSDILATAVTAYHEMFFGCQQLPESKRKRGIEAYIRQEIEQKLLILPYDQPAAKWHAIERTRLQQTGRTPPFIDGQIAAIAAANDLTLVTRNVSDFQYFQNLKIENWFE